jgi:deoxyribonuclease V
LTSGPIALLDVHYQGEGEGARAACLLAARWQDETAKEEWVVDVERVAAYRPGHFFERELPCLLQALGNRASELGVIVVDGYVELDQLHAPGLGGHLFEHFRGQIPVIGIAKRSFAGSAFATRVRRGTSRNPLFVTARGVSLEQAATWVDSMHGPHRIPTLCTRVDQLSRGLVSPSA